MRGNMAKVANVLGTLASHFDFCFKGSSTSFGENKLIVGLNSNCCDCSIKKNRKKRSGFWQTDMVECLIDERKFSMMKLDYVWSYLSKAFKSKKLFNAFNCHNEIG